MSAQVAFMLVTADGNQLKSELSTIAGWAKTLGLASDVRIGAGRASMELAGAGIGLRIGSPGAATMSMTAAAIGAAA